MLARTPVTQRFAAFLDADPERRYDWLDASCCALAAFGTADTGVDCVYDTRTTVLPLVGVIGQIGYRPAGGGADEFVGVLPFKAIEALCPASTYASAAARLRRAGLLE